jgi:hypothetical protein
MSKPDRMSDASHKDIVRQIIAKTGRLVIKGGKVVFASRQHSHTSGPRWNGSGLLWRSSQPLASVMLRESAHEHHPRLQVDPPQAGATGAEGRHEAQNPPPPAWYSKPSVGRLNTATAMPALDNPKWERFAQELAKGKTQAEAYANAGYKPSEPNASRLTSNDKVQARISELMERAAIRAEISIAAVTESLLRIAEKAEKLGEASGLNVAKSAWMDAAKVNGLIVERSESQNVNTNYVVSGDPVDNVEDWEAEHAPKH